MTFAAAYHATGRIGPGSPNSDRRSKEFDLVTLPPRQRVDARPAVPRDIPLLLDYAEAAMGIPLASAATVARITCAHPDSLWSFWRHGRLVGGFAVLMLNAEGLKALLADEIDLGDPPADLLASPGLRPAAIYVWAILGAAIASEGIARVIVRLQQYPYELADVFALPATADGLRFMRGLRFRLMPGHPRQLHRYLRLANRFQ